MSHSYGFRRGDGVVIAYGSHKGARGTVESAVFQRTVDYPNDYAAGYHVVVDAGGTITVRSDQVKLGGLPVKLAPNIEGEIG